MSAPFALAGIYIPQFSLLLFRCFRVEESLHVWNSRMFLIVVIVIYFDKMIMLIRQEQILGPILKGMSCPMVFKQGAFQTLETPDDSNKVMLTIGSDSLGEGGVSDGFE
jgi:hypothetical protein